MKNFNYLLLFAVFTISIFLISISINFDAKTGDDKFDKHLNELNKIALEDLSNFKKHISIKYHADENEISNMISIMEPVEILLVYEISRLINESPTRVISQYKSHKKEGWKKVLISLGINQTSSQYKDLTQLELRNTPVKESNPLSKK